MTICLLEWTRELWWDNGRYMLFFCCSHCYCYLYLKEWQGGGSSGTRLPPVSGWFFFILWFSPCQVLFTLGCSSWMVLVLVESWPLPGWFWFWFTWIVIQSGSVQCRLWPLAANWFLVSHPWLVHQSIGVCLPLLHSRLSCSNKCWFEEDRDKEEQFFMDEIFEKSINFPKIF